MIEYQVNNTGLNEEEQGAVKKIAMGVLNEMEKNQKHCLERCTSFADTGIDYLLRTDAENPRIEGCDENPFDQHYWLAFDINEKQVVIDPIFDYIGLESEAPDKNQKYYQRKRKVEAHKPHWEGGVRVKTIGI